MKFSRTLLGAAAVAASFAASSAFAAAPVAPSCSSWSSVAGYAGCTGFFDGNNSLTEANAQGFGSFAFEAKDNQTSQGASDSSLFDVFGDASSVKLTFNEAIGGEFLVSLKLGNFSAYYDFTSGVAAGETLTFTGHLDSYEGYGLSHASVYYNDVVPGVPEPETYALMLAGLSVVGFMARRRKQQA